MVLFRRATPQDAKAIAEIHVRAWQVAYREILPTAFLDSLSIDQRGLRWRQILERDPSRTSVLEERGEVLGWVGFGASRDKDALSSTGELWAIYVAPMHWRKGLGQHLWNEAEKKLKSAGFQDVTLWVLRDNANAIGFYRANGFAIDTGVEKTEEFGQAVLFEIRMRKKLGD